MLHFNFFLKVIKVTYAHGKKKKIQQNPFCLFNFESLIGTIQNNGYRALSSLLFVSFVMFFWLLLIFYLVVFFFSFGSFSFYSKGISWRSQLFRSDPLNSFRDELARQAWGRIFLAPYFSLWQKQALYLFIQHMGFINSVSAGFSHAEEHDTNVSCVPHIIPLIKACI